MTIPNTHCTCKVYFVTVVIFFKFKKIFLLCFCSVFQTAFGSEELVQQLSNRHTTVDSHNLKHCYLKVQSTLVISTSVISNNRLSRRENLIPVLT